MIVPQGKMTFMSKVFANLFFQAFLAYSTAKAVIESKEMTEQTMRNSLTIFISMLALIIALTFFRFSTGVKFILFSLLSILVGALMSSVKNLDKEALKEALAGTIGIFVVMFLAGVASTQFNIDMVPIALGLFFVYLATLFVSFFKRGTSKIFVAIFSAFILVETNLMLRKNYPGDFVNGSLDYFIDIINLFTRLLSSNSE